MFVQESPEVECSLYSIYNKEMVNICMFYDNKETVSAQASIYEPGHSGNERDLTIWI